ncbi:hypothetical protein OIDMADRAFT_51143 [Oidiodendron maius Zn]|uniref:Uncharacterized protein n=1 Tax=Oidiodendron maius (strain Zn) TaxID=913774 RepID=A0A0C3HSU8_OIDMZ|nr:hypothetical protein OIDMADRAFT_51143 [Oidiodendron maius Zn]
MDTFRVSADVPVASFGRSTGQWALVNDAWQDIVRVAGSTNGYSSVRNVPIMSLTIFLVGILLLGRATETGVKVAILLWWLKSVATHRGDIRKPTGFSSPPILANIGHFVVPP